MMPTMFLSSTQTINSTQAYLGNTGSNRLGTIKVASSTRATLGPRMNAANHPAKFTGLPRRRSAAAGQWRCLWAGAHPRLSRRQGGRRVFVSRAILGFESDVLAEARAGLLVPARVHVDDAQVVVSGRLTCAAMTLNEQPIIAIRWTYVPGWTDRGGFGGQGSWNQSNKGTADSDPSVHRLHEG